MKRFFAAVAAFLCLALVAAPALAINVVQPTGYYASDFASVLSADAKNHIEVNAKALDKATGAQIVFVTIRTTSPNTTFDYALALFNEWGIGNAQKNNGILVLLAIGDDDYYTIEGTGLERNLPTSELSALWNEYLEPDFAVKNYSQASVKYFDALFEKVAAVYGVNLAIDNASKTSYYGSGGSTSGSNFNPGGASYGASESRNDEGYAPFNFNFLFAIIIVIIVLSIFGGARGGCGCLPGLFGGWMGGWMFGPRRRPPGPGPWGGGPRRPGGFGGGGFGGGGFSGGGGRSRGSGGGRSGGGFGGFGGGGFGGGGGFSGGGGGSRGAGGGRGR